MLTDAAISQTRENTQIWGISGSTLKLIAIITMFIDHVGAAILLRMLMNYHILQDMITWEGFWKFCPWALDRTEIIRVYNSLRDIGRIAFPIFCFLLVEGFQKTRSVMKYALRLGIFALVSEIPFDLAFYGLWLEFSHQNVFFTLFLGLLVMAAWKFVSGKEWLKDKSADNMVKSLLVVAIGMGGAYLAEFLNTDYGAAGIMCILVLYLFSKFKIIQVLAGAVSFCWEMPAPLAFVPIFFYNGKRGMRIKYAFYLFYPLHLLFLYLVCRWLGIG